MDDSTTAPIVSRLDRLDFIMKYFERRTSNNSDSGGGEIERANGFITKDLALKEVQSEGSLLDRIESLETRLFQVKRAIQIEMESSGNSRTSSSGTSSQTSGDTFSLQSGDSSCSLPAFNNSSGHRNTRLSQVHVMTTTHEIEEKSDEDEQDVNLIPPNQTTKKNIKKKKGKCCKNGKKRNTPSWLHMRLLGC